METNLTLKLGLEFDSLEDAWQFWENYGGIKGFGVRKQGPSKSKKDNSITSYLYVCSKEGVRKSDSRGYKMNNPKPETRTRCQAKMKVKRFDEKYRVISFIDDHNHPLEPPETVHMLASQRRITEHQAYELEVAEDAGIQQKASFVLMSKYAGGRENLGYTRQDAKNYLNYKRRRDMAYGEAGNLLQYFQQQLIDNPSFFHAYQMDLEEQITNVFWADARMLLDYHCFGDVISLDTTYCTNGDHRPLAIFSGFNHYRGGVIFGAALLYDETTESFKWLLETFLQAHNQKRPQTIFTDQDQAMARALREVIPEAKHGLCTWHIMRNGIKHLGNLMKDGSHFLRDFKKCMYDCEEEMDFEASWKALLLKYNVEGNTWLNSTYQIKEKWAACYMKDAFTLGMRSTQLSESINSDIKSCTRPNLNISQFFKQFERVVQEKRYNELKQDHEMRQKLPRMIVQSSPLFRQLSQVYTPPLFNLFQREWDLITATTISKDKTTEVRCDYVITMVDEKGEWRVSYEPHIESGEWTITCSCRKFEQWGILCCHSLRILFNKDVKFLLDKYILKRWTRQARCDTVNDNNGKQINIDPRLESSNRYKQLCPVLLRLAADASDYPEASSLVYQGALELSKKVAEIRLNQQSHDTHGSTCEATNNVAKSSSSKGIGFKKKDGKKMRKNKRLTSWVDDLKQKRRKVKPLQPSRHKPSQVLLEASSSAPSLTYAHLSNFAPHSSQVSLGESTSNPHRAYSHVVPSASQTNQMSFTAMLMDQEDNNIPSLEALDLSQAIPDDISLRNHEDWRKIIGYLNN